jgi:hypothetical protein
MQKMVLVEWLDTTNGAGWYDLSDIADEQPTLVKTVGFLVQKDKKKVVLTASLSEGEGLGYVAIPAPWVKRIKRVRVG